MATGRAHRALACAVLAAAGVTSFAALPAAAGAPGQASAAAAPRFARYTLPLQARDVLNRPAAGEPSIGFNPASGAAMYMAGTQVDRVTFDDRVTPAAATWVDVTPPSLKVVSEDSVLFTDRLTGRTVAAEDLLACNAAAFTDNDGASWTPSEGCGPPAGDDHPTVGGGPFAAGTRATNGYRDAVYDCSQYNVDASCAISLDGGLTFRSPPTNLWHGACGAIHGHVKVGPDGVVYVPNDSCGPQFDNVGLGVSTDDNASWHVVVIPDSTSATSGQDPSVAIGKDGRLYVGYADGTGHPRIAVSADHGATWSRSTNVGTSRDPGETEDGLPRGIQNTEFATVVAGDAGRAAFAFLGTGTAGDDQSNSFTGVWYLFVSFTYDGGRTWQTVNATPGAPVQRGCIWNGGGVDPCRNLLDFNDATIDSSGRVLVAFTDGCTTDAHYSCDRNPRIDHSGCAVAGANNSETSSEDSSATCTFGRQAALVRQQCGRGLVAAADARLAGSCPRPAALPGPPRPPAAGQASRAAGRGATLPATGGRAAGAAAAAAMAGAALALRGWLRRRRGVAAPGARAARS